MAKKRFLNLNFIFGGGGELGLEKKKHKKTFKFAFDFVRSTA